MSTCLSRVQIETFVRDGAVFAELPSTNDYALQCAVLPDLATPYLVLAEHQTLGRGRGANRWFSNDGALTFSLVLDFTSSQLPVARRSQVSLVAGLAVRDGLADTAPGADFGLKWPNDVFLAGRKVSGILVEVPPKAQDRAVVGIGVNVNNSFADASDELKATATSLIDAIGSSLGLTDVLVGILRQFQAHLKLVEINQREFFQRWRQHCILLGRRVQLTAGPREAVGLCRGIDDEGALVLETDDGPQRFFGGVASQVRPL